MLSTIFEAVVLILVSWRRQSLSLKMHAKINTDEPQGHGLEHASTELSKERFSMPKNVISRGFPGGSVIKNLPSQCTGLGFDLWLGTKIPRAKGILSLHTTPGEKPACYT